MKFQSFLPLLFGLLFFSCTETKNETLSLNGTDWEFKQASLKDYSKATVPGSVQTDLLKLGTIPDPFLRNNEGSIQWVSEKDWIYKKQFKISSKTLHRATHILKFEGLDTYSQVTLNDRLILTTNNAFRTWEVDVSAILKAENELIILFKSVDEIEKTKASQLKYTLPEAPRVFTRKPQFQYGWDWGPTIKTMGIFRDVTLVSYDKIKLNDVFIETVSLSEEKANLTAHITINSELTDSYDIEISNNTTKKSVSVMQEISSPQTTYKIPITIDNPKLWWTHNLGEPFLYNFIIRLKKGNTIVEEVSKKVGLRTIELITEKDSIGESFYFKLNGKSVYMKGANYIPQNIFLSEVTKKQRTKLIDDAVEANMNMLRVWGGGVYEEDDFYNLCDEKGILIWQDFMFACAMYPGDDAYLENVKAEAIDNVKRLRNHPSIALWCGNNENSEGWNRWGWQDGKSEVQKQEIWESYQAVFNDILPKVVASLSPSISYWESSPKYGRGDNRYQFEGDAHDWWVWHDGHPFEHFEEEVPRFMSEFGFQSFPSFEAIKYFTQQNKIDINHPSFASHQKHSRGFSIINEYMRRDFPLPKTNTDYVYVSQLLQAYGIGKGIRAHRRAKPYNMGTLYWQLNDCWPAVSWSSIDGLGNWKALHYEAERVFENRLIIASEDEEYLNITVVDDSLEALEETLQITIKDFNGQVIKTETLYNAKTNTQRNDVLMKLSLADFEFDPAFSFAEITFGKERSIYYFEKPKNLKLPKQQLEISKKKTQNKITYSITSKTLQKNVYLYAAIPTHFSDNFFDLLPGTTKTVTLKTDGEMPEKILFKTLNGVQNSVEVGTKSLTIK
jgi:beta-mannosidase